MYFLFELRDGCAITDMQATAARFSRAKTERFDDEHHGELGGKSPVKMAAETRDRLLKAMPASDPNSRHVAGVLAVSGPLPTTSRTGPRGFRAQVLQILHEAVDKYVRKLESGEVVPKAVDNGTVPGRIRVKWSSSGAHYFKEDGGGRRDGRLSFEEFMKVLYTSGISWLTKEQMRGRFSVMDEDQSGFLSLGEVLRSCNRMVELVQQLRDYERELDRKLLGEEGGQRKIRQRSLNELMEGFISERCNGAATDSGSEVGG